MACSKFQAGYKAKDARAIAERAIKLAQERAVGKYEESTKDYQEKETRQEKEKTQQAEKEYAFYNAAAQLAK